MAASDFRTSKDSLLIFYIKLLNNIIIIVTHSSVLAIKVKYIFLKLSANFFIIFKKNSFFLIIVYIKISLKVFFPCHWSRFNII